jgi:hypothetical protein
MADEKHNQANASIVDSCAQLHSAGLHHDHVAEEAIGGHTADLGAPYFRSVNFIGTVVVGLHGDFICMLSLTGDRHVV